MKPKIGEIIELCIERLGIYGEGIGYFNGFVVFVEGALPEEHVSVRLTTVKKTYALGQLLKILRPSTARISPPCPVFGQCGGCQVMHLEYSQQLTIKRERVIDALSRIGKLQNIAVLPCIGSPATLGYRNKIQLPVVTDAFGSKTGLYARRTHDIIPIDGCLIHCEWGEQVFRIIKETLEQNSVPELRHILIKTAVHRKEVLVVLVAREITTFIKKIARDIQMRSPTIKGVVLNINARNDNVILGSEYQSLLGTPFITEELCGLTFKISAASFFQVNTDQAEHLYQTAIRFASLRKEDRVLDAYCGIGTLSLLIAQHAGSVIGIENVPQAIADANENAAMNDLQNATFICAAAEKAIKEIDPVDVVFLNPPRQGCDQSLLDELLETQPRTIVYISCDPATLARDLKILSQVYMIDLVQPVDMFPQTAHIECVVKLLR